MKFIKDGEIYKVIWISGPKHNLLGLVFTDQNIKKDQVKLIQLNNNRNEADIVNSLDIKEQVFAGLNEINSQLALNYNIKEIHYVSSDTPSADIYKELTKEIIKKLNGGFEFE